MRKDVVTALQVRYRPAASEYGRQSRVLVRWSRECEVIGLAQGPSRRKSQEMQELKPDAVDKATTQVQGPSRRKN